MTKRKQDFNDFNQHNDPGHFVSPEDLRFSGDFNAQLNDILMAIRLSREEVCGLNRLFEDIKHVLSYRWPGCAVMPFGSIVTGLGIRNSDADCFVDIPQQFQGNEMYVRSAERLFRQFPHMFCQLTCIPRAKVPIVKFFHKPTRRECDISFTSINGVLNSQLIGLLFNLDPRILPVAIIIKYWSKVHNLAGCNLFPNYGLIMMIIFYFQQIKILPSIEWLQQNCDPFFVNGWNTSFPLDTTQYPPIQNQTPPYHLLGSFFKYYNDFDFEQNIICPYLGYAVPRSLFKSVRDVPNKFNIYKILSSNDNFSPLNIKSYFCVQDVFDHSRNCAGVVPMSTIKIFLEQVKIATEIYASGNPQTFLKDLLTVKSKFNVPQVINNKMIAVRNIAHKGVQKAKKKNERMRKFHNTIRAIKTNILKRKPAH